MEGEIPARDQCSQVNIPTHQSIKLTDGQLIACEWILWILASEKRLTADLGPSLAIWILLWNKMSYRHSVKNMITSLSIWWWSCESIQHSFTLQSSKLQKVTRASFTDIDKWHPQCYEITFITIWDYMRSQCFGKRPSDVRFCWLSWVPLEHVAAESHGNDESVSSVVWLFMPSRGFTVEKGRQACIVTCSQLSFVVELH